MRTLPITTLVLCLLTFSIYLTSCEKSDSTDRVEIDNTLNPIEDLVAYLHPTSDDGTGRLYYKEGFLTEVISLLGATQIIGDLYFMNVQKLDGTTENIELLAYGVEEPWSYISDSAPDELKSRYKVYAGAECETLVEPETDSCEFIADRYVTEDLPIGWNLCVKGGDDLCVEIEQILLIRYIYEDPACSILIDIETHKGFHCTL